MNDLASQLGWIDSQAAAMRSELIALCEINSHSHNVAGVERVLDRVKGRLAKLADRIEHVPVSPAKVVDDAGTSSERPLASCLIATKRPDAKTRVLLNIHVDTVYPVDSPFQKVQEAPGNTLNGPGVADAKGGIVVLLAALEAFEQSSLAKRIGWEVIINGDEEIGSPGSAAVLDAAAKRNQFGLLYEPALPGGKLVSARKGSGNYTLIVHGRAAHAGRAIEAGRNAVVAASEIAVELHNANAKLNGATINVARLVGGGAANVVPDRATLVLNARAAVPEDVKRLEETIFKAQMKIAMREGYSIQTNGSFSSMPKVLDEKTKQLLDLIIESGKSIGLELDHGPSGGASDGNRLAAAGLACIDSLGPRGGDLHSDREFIHVESLVERAKLSLATLANIAATHGQ